VTQRALATIALLTVLLAATGCSLVVPFLGTPTPSPAPFCELPGGRCQTWVGVYGPPELYQEYVLQVGNDVRSLRGAPGVVSQEVETERLTVRVVEPATCEVILEFVADPGTLWVIRFHDVREASVTQVETMESGPGLGREVDLDCP
jgi:hypothetical protein